MPSTGTRYASRLPLCLAAGGLLLATAASVQAQDGGLGGLFQQLFAPRQAAPQPAPAPRAYEGGGSVQPERPRWRRAAQPKPAIRYVALPRPEAVKAEVERAPAKQFVDSKAISENPAGALMRDPTLRPGDIVVMPDGPKVFKGRSSRRHRISDFEDVKSSRAIDKKTRGQLLAMMVPVGAMPADEARKALARLRKLAPADEIAPIEQQARNETGTPRLVSPWTVAP